MPVRLKISDAKQSAINLGGKCLSTTYVNGKQPMLWECAVEAHGQFSMTYGSVRAGHWCQKCGVARTTASTRFSVQHAVNLASAKGGRCISTEYVNCDTPMRWKCSVASHPEWSNTFTHVQEGQWCLECFRDKQRVEGLVSAREEAAKRGGTCLSASYENSYTKLTWACSCGNVWDTTLNHVKNMDSWCPVCAVAAKCFAIEEVKSYIRLRGGECLSPDYQNNYTPIHVRCAEGHEWRPMFGDLRRGTWCPECSRWKRERECRDTLESLLGEKFPSATPRWFDGKERLDGYNAKLGLAFEHNGEQHYRYVPYFHRNGPEDLTKQQARDKRVEDLCDDNWTTLLVIPYWETDIRKFIEDALRLLSYI